MKKFFAILIAILLIVIFFPQILSVTFGKSLVTSILAKKLDVKASIGSIHLSWFGPQSIEHIVFSNPQMSGTISSLKINAPLWSVQKRTAFSMQNCILTFGEVTIGPFGATLVNRQIEASGRTNQGGRFSIKGTVESGKDFDIAMTLIKMPSKAVDLLFQSKGYFEAAAGPTFDLTAKVLYKNQNGDVQADFASPFLKASLQSEIAQDILRLKSPLQATLQFTSALSEKLDGVILSAKNPISLHVDSATIQIEPFAIKSANGTLDGGQLVFANIHPLVSLLTLLNRGKIVSKNASIWFGKAKLILDGDLLHVGRIDALVANGVHLCGWGDLNLQSEKLNMVFGIPADTLSSTLGIRNVSKDFVLQIPVSGSMKKPKFDTGSAAAKIGVLVASQQVTKKAGVFQGLLQKTINPVQEKKAPPPNLPFPWDKSNNSKN